MQDEHRALYLGPDTGQPYISKGYLLHNIILFGQLCKGVGIDVTPDRLIEAIQALEWIDVGKKYDVYHTLRAILVTRQRDLELFDQAFKQFWQAPGRGQTTLDLRSPGETRRQRKTQFLPPPGASPEDEHLPEEERAPVDSNLIAIVPTFTANEVLRQKDFAEMSGEEIRATRKLMEELHWSLATRQTRRYTSGQGRYLDIRAAMRRNLRYTGEFLIYPKRTRKIKQRPLVLLCDISGSMERYTRLFLQFMHALTHGGHDVESFVFGTRLTRITQAIHHRSIDFAIRTASTTVKDWGGGTRIGEALHTFNYRWSRRTSGHGAIVMLITDGWDRGDTNILGTEAARLRRNCYRFLWLNPLLNSPHYEPLTRGAQALLPSVDDFLPIANLANLEQVARALQKIEWKRP